MLAGSFVGICGCVGRVLSCDEKASQCLGGHVVIYIIVGAKMGDGGGK
jgi:hypothetical protein